MWWFLYQEVNSLRAGPKPHAALSCVLCSCSVMSNLCDTLDCSPPGSSVHGIFQARILEWVAISSSKGSSMTQWLNPCLWSLLHCNHWAIVEALCIFFFYFFLPAPCSMWDQTRDQTHSLCSGSAESYSLDCQGSSLLCIFDAQLKPRSQYVQIE